MLICPECGKESENDSKFCRFCGIIFYSVQPKTVEEVQEQNLDQTGPSAAGDISQDIPRTDRFRNRLRWALLLLLLALSIYYLPEIHVWVAGPPDSEPEVIPAIPSDLPQFDLAIDIPEGPGSLASDDNELIVGTGRSGSFLRIWREGNQYLKQWHRVRSASPIAWNGKEYIGYRESGFLQFFKKYKFTIHEKASFRILGETAAPEPIGGLSWDGAGYWAATREGDEQDRGLLYRLNDDLKVINHLVSPSDRCRGLAWDGSYLWFLDGRANNIYILDVKGAQVSIVGTYEIPIQSAAGIAYDGQTIWISDAKQGRLLRLSAEVTAALTPREMAPDSDLSKKEIQTVRNFDNYTGDQNFSNDDASVSSLSARVESNTLYASWHLYFGHNLLAKSKGNKSTFAKFTITVDGGTLPAPLARVYDARAGRNMRKDVPLASSLGPGTYYVRLFLYIQYTDRENRTRILSKSIPPLRVTNSS